MISWKEFVGDHYRDAGLGTHKRDCHDFVPLKAVHGLYTEVRCIPRVARHLSLYKFGSLEIGPHSYDWRICLPTPQALTGC